MNTPCWSKLEPLDEVMDDESMECLLVNTGAYHYDEQILAFAEGRSRLQDDVQSGWITLPAGILLAIRRAAREIKRQRGEIEAARERIHALESSLADFVALERGRIPSIDGKDRVCAYMRNGESLARSLDHARALLGYDKMPTDPHHGGKVSS